MDNKFLKAFNNPIISILSEMALYGIGLATYWWGYRRYPWVFFILSVALLILTIGYIFYKKSERVKTALESYSIWHQSNPKLSKVLFA